MSHWRGLDRGERVAHVGLLVLILGAIAVRLWLSLGYGPAFLGFGDSHEYVDAAANGVFSDPQKPAGYPIFLALTHLLSDRLSFTIGLQHALGIATGVLLYKAFRRTGAPPWLGLVPAAVVFFGGTGLLLEHSLLGDELFAFAQAVALYGAVRAGEGSSLRWAVLAGLALGASFWVKTVGISGVVLIPPLLLLGSRKGLPRRAAQAAALGGVALLVVLAYPLVQGATTGYWGYERESAWNLYGRVATFVDCTSFTPPSGTRFLCPSAPLHDRESEAFYQYARASPAVRRFGGPGHAPPGANAVLQRFSIAAIKHEPLAYAAAIVRGLAFFVNPRAGEGYTPASLREALLEPRDVASIGPAVSRYFTRHESGYAGAAGALVSYDEGTQVQGPVRVRLRFAAVVGLPLLAPRERFAAALFTFSALASALLAVAGNSYDARYGYPPLGPLAAGGALGGWGICRYVARRRALRSPRCR